MNVHKPGSLRVFHYNKKMKSAFVIVLLVIACSCSSTRNLQPTSADLPKASEKVPGITLNELQQGYSIYSIKCSACHRLHDPAEYPPDKWNPILSKMYIKAKITDENQKTLISNYVIAKSK